MLNRLIDSWNIRGGPKGRHNALLLPQRQFNREVACERVRATRRSIPFCLLTIELAGKGDSRKRARALARLLHRNLRMTDQKGMLGSSKTGDSRFGVLLVDTPEMGGRACLDRLSGLIDEANLKVSITLQVHDPEGFDYKDQELPEAGERRMNDDSDSGQAGPRIRESDVKATSEDSLIAEPAMQMSVKRVVDIIGASIGLIATSPLTIGGMLLVRITSPGAALFTQTREGHRGKAFTIFKIRTMVVDAESQQAALQDQSHRDGPAFKIARDPRVTKIGHLLRSTCIDELPQLWNVLRGEMSLVGPRPLPWHESRACDKWHRRRLDVRPGMTCYWQVNKEAAETFDDWMRMDLRYVDEGDLLGDFRIIAKTLTVPVMGRGGH